MDWTDCLSVGHVLLGCREQRKKQPCRNHLAWECRRLHYMETSGCYHKKRRYMWGGGASGAMTMITPLNYLAKHLTVTMDQVLVSN